MQKIEEHVLSNGIPVILCHYDGTVAANYWWVKAGSADEKKLEAGFAHFLEHMHFKDTDAKATGKSSTGKLARLMESLGGDVNAYTSFDQTVYHVTCAETYWEKVLEHFGEMARPQRFLKKDFESEREVILEELKKNEDSPSRMLFQNLFSTLFEKHPYGRPVIGYRKTLNNATVQTLEHFYKNHYTSDNMGLILVGPLLNNPARKDKILKILEKKFGKAVIKKKTVSNIKRKPESEIRNGVECKAIPFDVKTPTIAIGFRTPHLHHPDIPALDILAGILSNGELGRLYQKLFYDEKMVTESGGGLYTPKDPGMMYFYADYDSLSKTNDVLKLMLGELRKIRDQGPDHKELSRMVTHAESEKLYAQQSADGIASRVGHLKFLLGDLSYDHFYLEKLKSLTIEDIQKVAKKYFDPKRMSLLVMHPIESKFSFVEAKKIITNSLKPIKNAPYKKVNTLILPVVKTSKKGIKVVHYYRPQSNTFSIHASTLAGLRLEIDPNQEKQKYSGLSHLMSLTWTKGTEKMSAFEIAHEVESRAASLDGFSGKNSLGLEMIGLERDWKELSSLFSQILTHPKFSIQEIEHSKRVVMEQIKSIEDSSARVAGRLFSESVFGRHPYAYSLYGNLESIAGLSEEDLKTHFHQWVQPNRMVVSVSGNVNDHDLDYWMNELDSFFDDAIDFSEPTLKSAKLSAPRWVEKKLEREQQHLLVGGLGTTFNASDRYALRLLQNIMGGQSGRLFIELREKKSLAYSVYMSSMEGIERGYVFNYIATSPEKKEEALKGMQDVLEKVTKKGVSQSELKRAREFYLGRRAMDLQTDSALAMFHGLQVLYGLGIPTQQQLVEIYDKIQTNDIQKVCEKYFLESPQVTCIVG